MRTRNSILLAALSMAIATLFTYTDAGAFANGDGICQSGPGSEAEVFDCGQFGPNVIEFVGSSSATCTTVNFPAGTPCTAFFYRYTGSATNQVNTGIPDDVQTKYTDADDAAAGCSQLITDGSGDPTTSFLKGDLTQNVCRIANNLSGLPTNLNPPAPGTSNFFITADPSFAAPRPWQVRQSSNEVYAAAVNGPALDHPPVVETGATILTSDGSSCTYAIAGNQIILTSCTGGSVVPQEDTKFCCRTPGGVPVPTCPFPSNATMADTSQWHCETIAFATEQCDIKTTGADPWRYIGGKWVLIP